MAVLGVFAGADEQSVCVAEEGRLLAAECSVPGAVVAGAGGVPQMARRCLVLAGTPEASIEQIVIAGQDDDLLGEMFRAAVQRRVTPEQAHLALLGASGQGSRAALVVTGQHSATATVARLVDGRVTNSRAIVGGEAVGLVVKTVAATLGCVSGDRVEFLESIAGDADRHTGQRRVVSRGPGGVVKVDEDAFARRLTTVQSSLQQESLHVDVQRTRQELASDVLIEIADTLGMIGSEWMTEVGADGLTLTGGLLSSPAFIVRMARRVGGVVKAVAAEDAAVALGAALCPFDRPTPLTSLALGPEFDERDVKAVLENCRLDYLYEPRWPRLLTLVSRLLSNGALVAWFQGRSEFGRLSFGSRSVLADPSAAFVRENVNCFLLRRPVSAPLSVVVAPSLSHDAEALAPTEQIFQPPSTWRSHVGKAIDKRGNVRASVGCLESALVRLLECHRGRTGVGALVNVPMTGFVTSLADTPRDAIRAVFGSATDFLVIGRFVVAKDYRLLRSA